MRHWSFFPFSSFDFCVAVCGTNVHNSANPTQCAIDYENWKNGTILKCDMIEVT